MLYKDYYNKDAQKQAVSPTIQEQQERKRRSKYFIDSINDPARKEVFILNVAMVQPLTITDSIIINKDSFILLAME